MVNRSFQSEHERLQELVLGYEDLDPAEKSAADAHLASCAACTDLLALVRRVETARPVGALPAQTPLDPEESRQAEQSLVALGERILGAARDGRRASVPAQRDAPGRSWLASLRDLLMGTPSRRVAAALVSVSAVVVAVAGVALWPSREAPDEALIVDVHALRASGMRGADEGFHTGDAVELEIEIAKPAYLTVFHVDPTGSVAQIHPGASAPARAPAGRVKLPDPATRIEWRLQGSPGPETFLVVASADPILAEVSMLAQELSATDRAQRVRDLTALLERRLGAARQVEIAHLP